MVTTCKPVLYISVTTTMAGLVPSPKLLEELSRFFRVLSEPARLAFLCQLRDESLDVATLIERTGFSQSHLMSPAGSAREGRPGDSWAPGKSFPYR